MPIDERRGRRARTSLRGVAVRAAVAACLALTLASAASAGEPAELLDTWLTALAEDDYPAYAACLHGGARDVPEYGSREAMAFWAQQMARLRRRGFAGHFEIVRVTDDERLPAGALRAHPVVDGEPTRRSIVLIQEAGRWKILRLFS